MSLFQKKLSKEEVKSILNLFYRTDLREGETIIDNRDTQIAKELSLDKSVVSNCISAHLNNKFEAINDRINLSNKNN